MRKIIKKSYFVTSLVLAPFLFITQSCKQENTSTNSSPAVVERVEAPEQIVSLEQAQSMYANYTQRRVPIIQQYEDRLSKENNTANQMEVEQDSFIVARYIYYDYQTIKDYIAYIEQEAADAKVEISSLRFYLSNYPDKKEFENGKPIVHPKQNSILILPAVKAGKSEYGLYLEELEDGQKVPLYLSDDLRLMDSKEVGSLEEKTKNYATMVPSLDLTSKPIYSPSVYSGRNSLFLNEGGSSPPKSN